MTTIDYEAERRERQLREQREAALLRLKVRGVARLLGGRFLDEDAECSSHTIELAPTIQSGHGEIGRKRTWFIGANVVLQPRITLVPASALP